VPRRVLVIGAGITGLASAQGASGQNGAQLSYAYVAPLASPATLRALPALLLDGLRGPHGAALRLRPGLWPALGELSRPRVDAWRASLGDAAHDITYAGNGKLVQLRDVAGWQAACSSTSAPAARPAPTTRWAA
jgi:D-amino-acid dehydrogenase